MILLGVSGSIAAYKAVELLRLLLKARQDVHVLMTDAATHFVGPLTFQSLSGHPVLTAALDPQGWQFIQRPDSTGGMPHLTLAEQVSAMVVAPATADTLSRLAQGSAGDIICTCALALPRSKAGRPLVPVFLAPAMHEAMWLHPATQANVRTLKTYGYRLIGPEKGPLGRVGDSGLGRMTEPAAIASIVLKAIHR